MAAAELRDMMDGQRLSKVREMLTRRWPAIIKRCASYKVAAPEFEDLVRLLGGTDKCAYCGRTVDPDDDSEFRFFSSVIEHMRPLAAGGTNDLSNLTVSCPPCNMVKGVLWAPSFRFLTQWIPPGLRSIIIEFIALDYLLAKQGRVADLGIPDEDSRPARKRERIIARKDELASFLREQGVELPSEWERVYKW